MDGNMKSIKATYDKDTDTVAAIKNAENEEWTDVCNQYDNDVRKVKALNHQDGYTALYLCFDSDNVPFYYLVQEDKRLNTLRRKVFLSKLGIKKE